jgi:hypothetical protein
MATMADTIKKAIMDRQSQIARAVDEISMFVLTTADEWDEYHTHAGGASLTPMRFDGALPLIAPELLNDDPLFWDVAPGDLSYPLDLALVGKIADGDTGKVLDGDMLLHRFKHATLQEVRGKVRYPSRWMVAWDSVWIPNVGDSIAVRTYCSSVGPNEKLGAALDKGTFGVAGTSHVWLPNMVDGSMPPKYFRSEATSMINTAIALAFNARYDWHVRLGYEGTPTVRIPTDDKGVRSLFANRDIAEGHDRRAALKHWVGEHWRRNRLDDGETESLVRRYLRGEVAFTWGGFSCSLEPSRYDLDKNEELRKARAAMRKDATRRPARGKKR